MSDERPEDGARLPEGEFDRLDPDGAERRQRAEIEAERQAEARRLLLARLLADPEARAWLGEFVIGYCHAFEARFASTGYGPDMQGTFLYAGQQNAGWHLWDQLDRAAPELASLMRREHSGAA